MQKARGRRRKCEDAASIKIIRVGFDAEQLVRREVKMKACASKKFGKDDGDKD